MFIVSWTWTWPGLLLTFLMLIARTRVSCKSSVCRRKEKTLTKSPSKLSSMGRG
jgi:hypothetical protein